MVMNTCLFTSPHLIDTRCYMILKKRTGAYCYQGVSMRVCVCLPLVCVGVSIHGSHECTRTRTES